MSSFCKGCDSWKRRRGSPAYKKWKILHVKECFEEPQWFSWHDGDCGNGSYISAFIRSSFCEIYILHRGWRFKTFSSITASIRMEKISQFQKIECVGHVQKNGNSFTKIKTNELPNSVRIDWGKERLTDRMIDLITTYYGNAIRQNKNMPVRYAKAVCLAVYFHIRSKRRRTIAQFCPVGLILGVNIKNQVVVECGNF
ncbi:uncharacterized protein TNCV_2144061 [Trichonephila clavipes]|nr:uncharacterized protein TNCV_2144061 [Trichonephila clavipes]